MKNKKKIGCIIVIILIAIIGLFFLLKPNFSKNKSNTEKLKETLSTQDPYEDNSELDTSKLNYNLELTKEFDDVRISGKQIDNIYNVKITEKINYPNEFNKIIKTFDGNILATKLYDIKFYDIKGNVINPKDTITVYFDDYSSEKNYIKDIQKDGYCAFVTISDDGNIKELNGTHTYGDDAHVVYFDINKSGKVLVINYKE